MPLMQSEELTDLQEIAADLRDDLQQTLEFRKRTMAEYPQDGRNEKAVLLITRLIPTVDDISPVLLQRFDAALDDQLTDEPWDHYLRSLAFKFAPGSAGELVMAFINEPQRFVVDWKSAIKGTA